MLEDVIQHNLNLLPALALLIETKSVSEAARRMHITQSAMSRNLSLLRDALNDPILVRSGNITIVTPTAQQMLAALQVILGEASSIFENPFFEPGECTRNFRISASYTYTFHVLTEVLKVVHSMAPKMTLATMVNTNTTAEMLTTGNIDIYVGFLEDMPDSLNYGEMFTDQMYIVMRKDHPLARVPLDDLALLLDYPYIQLSGSALPNRKSHKLDKLFSRSGSPWLATTIPRTAFDVICRSDAFSFMTATEFAWSPELNELSCRPLPDPIRFSNKIIWPVFSDSSRSHRWLRERMITLTPRIMEKSSYCRNIDAAVCRSLAACGRQPDSLPSKLFSSRPDGKKASNNKTPS